MKKNSRKVISLLMSIVMMFALVQPQLLMSVVGEETELIGGGNNANTENNEKDEILKGAIDPVTATFSTWVDVANAAQLGTDYVLDTSSNLTINTAKGLAWFASSVNGTLIDENGDAIPANTYADKIVRLSGDINLDIGLVEGYGSAIGEENKMADTVNEINSWQAIGIDGNEFLGTFNGNGNEISGVYINLPEKYYQGLFGDSRGEINDIGVVDSHIIGNYYVGGVVGNSENNIINSYNAATVEGFVNVGGIAGNLRRSDILNSYNTGDINGNKTVGGIAGDVLFAESKVENCYNTGKITGNNYFGAIVGEYDITDDSHAIISNYYLEDTTTLGIGNEAYDSTTTLVMPESEMTGDLLLSSLNNWVETKDSEDFNTWTSSATYPVFGEKHEVIIDSWIKLANTARLGEDYELDSNYNLTIHNAKGLAWFASSVNGTLIDQNGDAIPANTYADKIVRLSGDINLDTGLVEGYGSAIGEENQMADTVNELNSWQAIASYEKQFKGTFNGNGYEVSGIYINMPNTNDQGLFGYSMGEITNVSVVNSHIIGYNNVGGVVGFAANNVINSYNAATVKGNTNIGGIAGGLFGDDILNCYNTGDIDGDHYVGGILGDVSAAGVTVENCYNTGRITGSNGVGAIAGNNHSVDSSPSIYANNYYLVGTADKGIGDEDYDATKTLEMSEIDMQSILFVDKLNEWVETKNSEEYYTWASGSRYPVYGEKYEIPVNEWIKLARTANNGIDYEFDTDDNLTINTVKGLAWFASSVNGTLIDENGQLIRPNSYNGKTVTLKADTEFDLTKAGIENYTGNGNEMGQNIDEWNSWQAIGTDWEKSFYGVFNGNGNEISGVYINLPNTSNQGLFGECNGEITNVGVVNSHIIGYSSVGGIVGDAGGSISNVFNYAQVIGNDKVGGIAGYSHSSISNSFNMGDIALGDNPDEPTIGGITGSNEFIITNCYNMGDIIINDEPSAKAGGIVGENNGVIKNCYNVGNIVADESGADSLIGSIVAYNFDNVVVNCYYLNGSAPKGIGTEDYDPMKTLEMSETDMKSSAFVDTLNEWVENENSADYNTWISSSSYPVHGVALTPRLNEWDKLARTAINGIDYELDTDDNLTINTVIGLAWFSSSVNGTLIDENGQLIRPNSYNGKTVTLKADTEFDLTTANIDGYSGTGNQMSNSLNFWNSWQAIGDGETGYFSGSFNGNGNEISGVYINLPNESDQGLFGYLEGEITNVGVVNSHIIGYDDVSGIVGESYGYISNVYSNSQILGEDFVGGIVGYNEGTVINSYNMGEVTATLNEEACVGGITGYNYSEIINCYNVGKVFAIGADGYHEVGGIVGSNDDGYVANCYYLDSSASVGIGSLGSDNFTTISMTESEMKSSEFVETLNYGVKAINELGILTWKGEANAYPIFGEPFTELITENLWVTFANTAILDEDYVLDTDGNLTINTVKGLAWFASSVNGTLTDENGQLILPNSYDGKTVTLKANTEFDLTTANIDGYSGTGNQMSHSLYFWNSWQAIGADGNKFNGVFNGNGNEISGVYIILPSNDYQGLFGYSSGEITNVGVVNSHIIGDNDVGGIVGVSYGYVSNVYSDSQILGEDYVGGIVGDNNDEGTVMNSYNLGEVTATLNEYAYVGGIAGDNDSEVINCYNVGKVFAIGTGGDHEIGGIVGSNDGGYVANSYYLDSSASVGIGSLQSDNFMTISMTESKMKSSEFVETLNKGVKAINELGILTWKGEANAYPIFGEPFTELITENLWVTFANTAISDVDYVLDADDNLTINTVKGLAWFASSVNGTLTDENGQLILPNSYDGKTVRLKANTEFDLTTANIDGYSGTGNQMSNWVNFWNSWQAIGTDENRFYGVFNGNGNEISGIYINLPSNDYQGLFGKIDAGITNVGVVNSHIIGYSDIGGIAGFNYGTFDNCYNSGTIFGISDNIGGIVGYVGSIDGVISNSYNTGDVTGDDKIGGIVGYVRGEVFDCYNTGNVVGDDDIGGIAASCNDNTIYNVYNTGSVTGDMRVGGIVGNNGATVYNVFNLGKVIGRDDVGGVVGINEFLFNSYNKGEVVATSNSGAKVGGVVGNNHGPVENCYNVGNVSATGGRHNIGSVIGYNDNLANIDANNLYYLNTSANLGIGNEAIDAQSATVMSYEQMQDSNDLLKKLNEWVSAEETSGNTTEFSNWALISTDPYPVLEDLPTVYKIEVTNGTANPSNAEEGNIITLTANEIEGKAFTSWSGLDGITFIEGNSTTATVKFTMPAKNVAVSAVYEDVIYNINVTNGTANPATATMGEAVTITASEIDGKKFAYWSGLEDLNVVEGNATTATVKFAMPAKNVDVSAVYEDVIYNINVTNATANPTTAKMGETVTITASEIDGKEFSSWSGLDGITIIEGNATTATVKFTMPAKNVDVSAAYEDVIYNINVTNGTANPTTAKMGETVTITASEKDGKVFSSWSGLDGLTIIEGNATTATVKFTMPAKNVDVSAAYQDDIYNINVTNGTANPETAKMGETVTITASEKDGKEFTSWSGLEGITITEGNATTATVEFTMPAKNVDVSVNYVDIYEVTFNLQGGNINNSTTDIKLETDKNGKVAIPSTPSKDKNIFIGWFTEMTGGVEVTSITSFTENTTIYARWEETTLIPQTLNFENNSVSKLIGDSSFTNKLSGAMTSVTFTSSNEDVATVDSQGNVTIVGEAGTAIITATAVETEVYAAASVNYTITVNTVGGESLEELQDYLASFTGDFDDLDKVFFNGVELLVTFGADRNTAYLSGYPKNSTTIIGEVTQGSIVIKLYSEFLKTLPQANYNLSVSLRSAPNSLAGTTIVPVPAASTVDPSPTPGPTTTPDGETPETGDVSVFVMMFGVLAILTFAGMFFVLYNKRKLSKNKH